jgi:hypothetical protein
MDFLAGAMEELREHAHLCVLAYLLMRIAENRVEESWPLIREKVERVLSTTDAKAGH